MRSVGITLLVRGHSMKTIACFRTFAASLLVSAASGAGAQAPINPWDAYLRSPCDSGKWEFATEVDEFAEEKHHYAVCHFGAPAADGQGDTLAVWRNPKIPGALAVAVLKRGIILLGRPETVYRIDGQAPIRPAPLPHDIPVINKLTGMMATGTPGSFVVSPEHVQQLLQAKEFAVRFDIAGGSFRSLNAIKIEGIADAVAKLDQMAQ